MYLAKINNVLMQHRKVTGKILVKIQQDGNICIGLRGQEQYC